MNVCNDGVFHFLTNDLKTPKFVFRFSPDYLLVPNKSSKTCTKNRGAKLLQLSSVALGNQFNPSVGQVADDAGNFKAGGDGFGGVTKTDALDPSRIKNGQTTPGR